MNVCNGKLIPDNTVTNPEILPEMMSRVPPGFVPHAGGFRFHQQQKERVAVVD